MSTQSRKKVAPRGMKHLLIHQLLKYELMVFESVSEVGIDLAVGKIISGELRCIVAQVRTSSLSKRKDYAFNVFSRNKFVNSPKFFHFLCLEEQEDELRPTYLIIPNPELKKLIEKKIKTPASWKRKRHYPCHLSKLQLNKEEWIQWKNRFDLICEQLSE
ncbi:hypothetical protein KAR91_15420 [Candidatus Pacearchaeota archaeon]|nr:hypothetical protein [Candidatus Pacearchaeota archaeon]